MPIKLCGHTKELQFYLLYQAKWNRSILTKTAILRSVPSAVTGRGTLMWSFKAKQSCTASCRSSRRYRCSPAICTPFVAIRYPHHHPITEKLSHCGTQNNTYKDVSVVIHDQQHNNISHAKCGTMDGCSNKLLQRGGAKVSELQATDCTRSIATAARFFGDACLLQAKLALELS